MNALIVINIGKDEIFKYSSQLMADYARKYNLHFRIISKRIYDLQKLRTRSNYIYTIFEKNQIFNSFKEYDRILRVDSDVIIKSDTPNLFDIVPEDKIGVVLEDVGSRRSHRLNQIQVIQKDLGKIPEWKTGYFNSGIVLVSKQHKEIFKFTPQDIERIEKNDYTFLGAAKEQNTLNWKVRKNKFKIHELDFKYNHMSMFSEAWNNKAKVENSYIIHYAGTQHQKMIKMQKDYNRFS